MNNISFEDLKEYAEMASGILEKDGTPYKQSKGIIQHYFENSSGCDLGDIIRRLVLIDNFYATNMRNHLYGIEKLADAINKLGNDETIKNLLNEYLDTLDSNRRIYKELLDEQWGISKTKDNSSRAYSLITKYAYFVSEYQFPIYDSLAIFSIKYFYNRGGKEIKSFLDNIPNNDNLKKLLKSKQEIEIIDYFKIIKEWEKNINMSGTEKKAYDKLDQLLWLCGKIRKGSLSAILTEGQFKGLKEVVNRDFKRYFNNQKFTSANFDDIIVKKLGIKEDGTEKDKEMDAKVEKFFSEDLRKFINFVKPLQTQD
jgi:hypothetical protein